IQYAECVGKENVIAGTDCGAFAQRLELGPTDLRVHTVAHAAVRAGDDVLFAHALRVLDDAVRHQLRVLHHVAAVAADAGDEDLAIRQLDVAPDLPLVLVAWVGRFDGVGLRRDLQHEVDDVLELDVAGVRAVPATPADVVADAVLR